MSSSLHYVTPLQLSDTFNEWFLRSNDLIDVVNKINVYNVENGWGLARYRSIDGTTLIRLNIGQEEKEYDGTAVASDYTYGLRFIANTSVTGGANPDVSSTRKILTLDFENLPSATGGVSGASVHETDYFAFSDTSSGTGSIRGVQAQDMLPYGISGDHRFYGNIYFDGDNTVINSTELNIDDKLIYIATNNTNDTTDGYLNDQNLQGAGLVIRGASGDKEFTYEYTEVAGGGTYHAFKSNIDIMFGADSSALCEDNSLKFLSLVDDDFDISFRTINGEDKFWKIRRTKSGDTQGRLVFFHENTTTGISADAISLSKLGTVKIHQLDGDIVDGVTHESTFKHQPAPYSVPTSGMSGDSYLHYKWTNRKTIDQVAHGFTAGDLLRYYPSGTTYDKAYNSSKATAEVVAIVEDGSPGSSADQFVGVFSGLVDLSLWTPQGWSAGHGTTMSVGEVYFLDGTGNSGGFTSDEPITDGEIRKPILVATGQQEGLFVNYLGNVVATGDAASATGDIVYSDGYLLDTSILPNQEFKNKVVNGDFSFWQRAEDGIVSGGTSGAINWDGSTGTRFTSSNDAIYTSDMWMIDTRPDGTLAESQKHGHTFASGPSNTSPYTTGVRGSYMKVLNNTSGSGSKSYLINRIENVGTLAPSSGTSYATLSYYVQGSSAGVASMDDMTVSLWQVFDGNSGDGIDYGGGASSCWGVNLGSGVTNEGGHSADIPTSWTKQSHTFILKNTDGISAGYNENYNWLEVKFELPTQWGVSGGIDLARVQLEGGSGATDWDNRPIQIEESIVNRYYQRHFVLLNSYADAGGTLGASVNFDATPYPYYGYTPATNLNNKCVYVHNARSNNCAVGATTDVSSAAPGNGFFIERINNSGSAGMVGMGGIYHFDFGIYDD